MGQIGKFGTLITFEVSANKILTPKNIKRTVSGRWQKHNILNKKPKLEFTGPDSDGTTLEVVLSAEHGVKPRSTIEKIEKAIAAGQVAYLSIGGKIVGSNKMCIESMSEEWNQVWNKGELVKATVNLTFTEYT